MNPATKISTLLIVTLSLLCSAEGNTALVCNVCAMSRNSRCTKLPERCPAASGQSCATISHYSRGKHLYSKHLCMSDCREEEIRKEGRMTYIMCCRRSLCNAF